MVVKIIVILPFFSNETTTWKQNENNHWTIVNFVNLNDIL